MSMPCSPSDSAGEPARAVRRFVKQKSEAQRDHDQRQMAKARDDETRGIAEQRGHRGGHQQSAERLAPDEFGEQPGGIGADAEERGMAERDDACVTEDQIERERKQRGDAIWLASDR